MQSDPEAFRLWRGRQGYRQQQPEGWQTLLELDEAAYQEPILLDRDTLRLGEAEFCPSQARSQVVKCPARGTPDER